MKTKKILYIFHTIILILTIATIFQSCATKKYSVSVTCRDLSSVLKREISVPEGEFNAYADEEIRFFFSSPELYDDVCIVYSTDSTDVCEVGILHAEDEENAKMLYEDAKNYIKSLQEQKSDFLRNYSPAELSKLNSAEVRRFGNYIIFVVAEQSDKEEIFKKADAQLTQ